MQGGMQGHRFWPAASTPYTQNPRNRRCRAAPQHACVKQRREAPPSPAPTAANSALRCSPLRSPSRHRTFTRSPSATVPLCTRPVTIFPKNECRSVMTTRKLKGSAVVPRAVQAGRSAAPDSAAQGLAGDEPPARCRPEARSTAHSPCRLADGGGGTCASSASSSGAMEAPAGAWPPGGSVGLAQPCGAPAGAGGVKAGQEAGAASWTCHATVGHCATSEGRYGTDHLLRVPPPPGPSRRPPEQACLPPTHPALRCPLPHHTTPHPKQAHLPGRGI